MTEYQIVLVVKRTSGRNIKIESAPIVTRLSTEYPTLLYEGESTQLSPTHKYAAPGHLQVLTEKPSRRPFPGTGICAVQQPAASSRVRQHVTLTSPHWADESVCEDSPCQPPPSNRMSVRGADRIPYEAKAPKRTPVAISIFRRRQYPTAPTWSPSLGEFGGECSSLVAPRTPSREGQITAPPAQTPPNQRPIRYTGHVVAVTYAPRRIGSDRAFLIALTPHLSRNQTLKAGQAKQLQVSRIPTMPNRWVMNIPFKHPRSSNGFPRAPLLNLYPETA